MKKIMCIIGVIAFSLFFQKADAQVRHDIKAIIDTAIVKAKQHAFNSHRVSWEEVRTNMHEQAANAVTPSDLKAPFQTLLKALHDSQGTFTDANHNTIASFPVYKDAEVPVPDFTSDRLQFECKKLDQNIGYIRISGLSSENIEKEATMIRSAIDTLNKEDLTQWILDLRFSNTGNMHAMLAGIGPLVGEGLISSVANGKGKIKKLYEIHNGKFYDDKRLVVPFATAKDMRQAQVAVLTSKFTSGAAEIVAINMKGRKQTKFFGEPTAGNATQTISFKISHDITMTITENVYHDRRGFAYKGHVQPDVQITDCIKYIDVSDKALEDAIAWLTTNTVVQNNATTVSIN